MHLKNLDRMVNSVDPDQTAPSGAVSSWSALVAQTKLPQYLEFLWIYKLTCTVLYFSRISKIEAENGRSGSVSH